MRGRTYFYLVLLLLICVGVALVIPSSAPFFRGLAMVPAIGAVAGAVFMVLQKELDYQRQLQRDSMANGFHIAAQSHMAKAVFDKHIAFAEAYTEATLKAYWSLLENGPSSKAMDIALLRTAREQHRLWIAPELGAQLDIFERNLVDVGARMSVWERTGGAGLPSDYWDRTYALFGHVTGMDPIVKADVPAGAQSVQMVLGHLQGLLGIAELTGLRDKAVKAASPT